GPASSIVGQEPFAVSRFEEMHGEVGAGREPWLSVRAELLSDGPWHAVRQRDDTQRVERAVGKQRWIVEPNPSRYLRCGRTVCLPLGVPNCPASLDPGPEGTLLKGFDARRRRIAERRTIVRRRHVR